MQIKITLALLGLVSSAAANPYCNENNCYRGLLRINEKAGEGHNPATDACRDYFDKCEPAPNDHLTIKCSGDLTRYLAACRCLFGDEVRDPQGIDPTPLTTCTTDQACCGGYCKDIKTDEHNCGTCGLECEWRKPNCKDGLCYKPRFPGGGHGGPGGGHGGPGGPGGHGGPGGPGGHGGPGGPGGHGGH
ncbi:hypothetical protein TWF696_005897 [Orbilia brochopaga]|uniref:Uncharacterized protein n=1 Tax=Orbilia brochopaga TaxID=3140254 RepID=A0AAV9UV64_9PEZI